MSRSSGWNHGPGRDYTQGPDLDGRIRSPRGSLRRPLYVRADFAILNDLQTVECEACDSARAAIRMPAWSVTGSSGAGSELADVNCDHRHVGNERSAFRIALTSRH